jgi:hypothetical protein
MKYLVLIFKKSIFTNIPYVVMMALLFGNFSYAGSKQAPGGTMYVGVSRIDITPEGPIRLAGYASRKKTESEGVLQKLEAKALAFGSDAQHPSILITLDLVGIPGHITKKLSNHLAGKMGIDPAQLVICASHTHGGPEVGNLLNILQYRSANTYSDSLLDLNQLVHINQYVDQLSQKLEKLSIEALKARKPSLVSWGQGQAMFAKNRRTPGGPVDVALPVMRVTDIDGKLRAILVNYACHGTTLSGDINQIHGDWIGEAQRLIEINHPEAVALIAIGAGADANPQPRGTMEHVAMHAREISDHVDKMLATAQMQPLTAPPVCRMKWVKLPFAKVPSVPELIHQTKDTTVKGYYARLALDRLARGQTIPAELDYPVQTWAFGNALLMINLAGEVVVDYSVRLKETLGAEHIWLNTYANDVPSYIASKRVIKEGGYEADASMYYYDKPSPYAEQIEDIIINAVQDILPASFKTPRPSINKPVLKKIIAGKAIDLYAESARTIGPDIKYMPEWRAFGWFTESDLVEWDIDVNAKGTYEVYLDWSVSDDAAGKPFALEGGDQRIMGTVGKTGSWFTYRLEMIGNIHLSPSVHKLVFKADSTSPKGALLDLRSIRLKPVR